MSFLAGRLAGKEAAYFLEESKQAVARLVEKNPKLKTPPTNSESPNGTADILPEILRHSLPAKILRSEKPCDSSLSTDAKWAVRNSDNVSSSVSPDVLNPLRGFLSLPQVTLGPKRWQLPTAESSITASTANDLRLHQQPEINPEKIRAAAEGFAQIGTAFAVATAIIFGSAAVTYGLIASKLDIHTSDDIKEKGRELVQRNSESFRKQLDPLRDWAENTSKKWRLKKDQNIKENPIVKELSKILRAKDSA
ncbi:unnamed protein product [Amaranthus hypochondriacus]